MAKKKASKRETKVESDEQLDLIDVAPENAKPIVAAARLYKKASSVRQAALADEVKYKHRIIELVKEAKLQPLEGGVIKFTYNGVTVSITPRDELVKVKDDKETE